MFARRSIRAIALSLGLFAVAATAIMWSRSNRNESGSTLSPDDGASAPLAFVDESRCGSCHAAESRAWLRSHHAASMQVASAATVRGDFSNQSFNKGGVRARFFQRDGRFFVNTEGPDGHPADFEVKYTFGAEPLQQYLLALPRGRLQAFPIAWDVRGQHWFDLNPNAGTDHRDDLHWTQPAYNWNFMCAECHSTDVRKNYDAAHDAYRTRFSQVNVGCQACHGPASRHLTVVEGAHTGSWGNDLGFTSAPMTSTQAAQLDACGRCHSRRASVSGAYQYGRPLLDTHLPSLLDEGLYFADGQFQDEVYEYGSFLQSKMHAKGVRCSDCHEPHSLETRAPGNDLCTTCHNDGAPSLRHAIDVSTLKHKNYDSPAHHFHPVGSPGAQCVSCHMPSRTYMTVQARHDHSLKIPRPDLSATLRDAQRL